MKFENIKLIQQLMILSNMINKPDVSKRLEENIYRVPDSDYAIDAVEVYTATNVYIPTTFDTEVDSFDINFTDVRYYQDEDDKVNLEFILSQTNDKDAPIDKFGLLAGLILRGDLVAGLKKIISVLETLTKLGFVKNNPTVVLKRMLELIPIAKTLPDEFFERVYIDPIGARVVKVIHESVDAAIRTGQVDYLKEGITIEDYYYGHVVQCERRAADESSQKLRLTIGYGILGLNNVISIRVTDYNGEVFKPEFLVSLKVTSLHSPEWVLENLKKELYNALDKHESKELLIPLADVYFVIMDEARTDIIGRLMSF